MGYSLNRQLVEQNTYLLEDILSNLKQGKETILPATPDTTSNIAYSVNRILKAAQMFTDISQGRYSNIRDNVKVHTASTGTHISIQPKGRASASLVLPRNTEAWVLLFLTEYRGNLVPIEFYPSESFDESSFAQQVDGIGWMVHLATKQIDGDKLTYAFERKEEEGTSGFGLLRKSQTP